MSKNRDKIIESARFFFSQQDFERVSIKEICGHAGVSCGIFYYHFQSKGHLMDYLRAESEQEDPERVLAMIAQANRWEQLYQVLYMHSDQSLRAGHHLTAQCLKRKLTQKLGDDEIRFWERKLGVAATLTAQAQEAGELGNPNDSEALALAGIHMANGILMSWCTQDGNFDLEDAVRRALEVLFDVRADLRRHAPRNSP